MNYNVATLSVEGRCNGSGGTQPLLVRRGWDTLNES